MNKGQVKDVRARLLYGIGPQYGMGILHYEVDHTIQLSPDTCQIHQVLSCKASSTHNRIT